MPRTLRTIRRGSAAAAGLLGKRAGSPTADLASALITETVISGAAPAEAFEDLARIIRDVTRADEVGLLLREPDGQLSLLARCGTGADANTGSGRDLPLDLPADATTLANEVVRENAARTRDRASDAALSGGQLRHLVAVPLEPGSLRGAMLVGFQGGGPRTWQRAQHRMVALAPRVAAVAELLRMRQIEGAATLALRESEQLSRAAIDTAVDGILTIDQHGVLQTVNPAGEAIFGYSSAELVGRNVTMLMPEPYASEHDGHLSRYLRTGERRSIGIGREVTGLRRDGTTFPMDLAVSELWLGSRRLFTGVVRDISERRNFQARLAYQALHDPLTGLANRALLVERIEHTLAHFDRGHGRLALLFLDLDRFKVVNDSMGHDAGDQMLIEAARRLHDLVRPSDTVARLGGDEFVLLCEDVADIEDAAAVAARVVTSLSLPFPLRGGDAYVSASVGVALGKRGDVAQDLLRDADAAMYEAKSAGKACFEIFNESMQLRARGRMQLQTALHRALEREEFELQYQPEVDLVTGSVVAVEALLRWRHPQRGLLLPAQFLDQADDAGLMPEIDRWVLNRACHDTAFLSQRLGRPLTGWVNVSPRMFSDPVLVEVVVGALAASGLPGELLGLEITEGVLMQDAPMTLKVLERLKGIGVRLIVDDFGTGYSSLAYLRHFPVDGLKIDRGFVSGLPQDEGNAAIVQAVVTLARSMRISAVAEGVETAEQLASVSLLGCPLGQGFLLGRPGDTETTFRAAEAGAGPLTVPGEA